VGHIVPEIFVGHSVPVSFGDMLYLFGTLPGIVASILYSFVDFDSAIADI